MAVYAGCQRNEVTTCLFFNVSFHQLKDLLRWYAEEYKDPMVLDPPEWFQSFILCEALFQTPFFPIAAYAFLKGQSTLNVSSCFTVPKYLYI